MCFTQSTAWTGRHASCQPHLLYFRGGRARYSRHRRRHTPPWAAGSGRATPSRPPPGSARSSGSSARSSRCGPAGPVPLLPRAAWPSPSAPPALSDRNFTLPLQALLAPDATDEEIRRETAHVGIFDELALDVRAPSTPPLSLSSPRPHLSTQPLTGISPIYQPVHPRLPARSLPLQEKGTVYNEMLASFQQADFCGFHELNRLVYGRGHPLGFEAGGTPQGIRESTPERMRLFHGARYRLENMGAPAAAGEIHFPSARLRPKTPALCDTASTLSTPSLRPLAPPLRRAHRGIGQGGFSLGPSRAALGSARRRRGRPEAVGPRRRRRRPRARGGRGRLPGEAARGGVAAPGAACGARDSPVRGTGAGLDSSLRLFSVHAGCLLPQMVTPFLPSPLQHRARAGGGQEHDGHRRPDVAGGGLARGRRLPRGGDRAHPALPAGGARPGSPLAPLSREGMLRRLSTRCAAPRSID